jgi:two-component system response regulator (stage 0 sporulation protein A)
MHLPKVLIADPSEDLRYLIADLLQGYADIMTAATGPEALRLLGSFRPDVLVLDMMLPGLDGISLLYRAEAQQKLPAVLALTTYTSDYLLRSFGNAGVDYAMLKPFDTDALVSRVLDLSREIHPAAPVALGDLLLRLGIQPKRRGYLYLVTSIALAQKDPNQAITKELYPAVAKLCGGTAAQVERDIRFLIHTAWNQHREETWRSCLQIPASVPFSRPTNAAFIFRMAKLFQDRQGHSTALFPEK